MQVLNWNRNARIRLLGQPHQLPTRSTRFSPAMVPEHCPLETHSLSTRNLLTSLPIFSSSNRWVYPADPSIFAGGRCANAVCSCTSARSLTWATGRMTAPGGHPIRERIWEGGIHTVRSAASRKMNSYPASRLYAQSVLTLRRFRNRLHLFD